MILQFFAMVRCYMKYWWSWGVSDISCSDSGKPGRVPSGFFVCNHPFFGWPEFHPYPKGHDNHDMKAQFLLRILGFRLFFRLFFHGQRILSMLGIQRAKVQGFPDLLDLLASRIPALPGFVGEKPVASDRSWHAAQGQRWLVVVESDCHRLELLPWFAIGNGLYG